MNAGRCRAARHSFAREARARRLRDTRRPVDPNMSSKRLEFGGPAGALAIMLASHVAVYYLHLCVDAAGGDLYPLSLTPAGLRATWADLRAHATPTIASWCAYLGFLAHQWLASSPGAASRRSARIAAAKAKRS